MPSYLWAESFQLWRGHAHQLHSFLVVWDGTCEVGHLNRARKQKSNFKLWQTMINRHLDQEYCKYCVSPAFVKLPWRNNKIEKDGGRKDTQNKDAKCPPSGSYLQGSDPQTFRLNLNSISCLLCFFMDHLNVLLHYDYKSSLGCSCFHPAWQLNFQHPLSNLSTISAILKSKTYSSGPL